MATKSEVTVDFDHHAPIFCDDRAAAASELQKCPVSWTENHGGYWVVSKFADVDEAGRRAEIFASGNDHGSGPLKGLSIPFVVTGAGGLIETDPPRHGGLRKLMNPWFSPTAVSQLRPLLEDDVTYFIDQFIEHGEADLVSQLIGPFPGLVTLRLLGVPIEYYERMAYFFHRTLWVPPGTQERDEVDAGMGWIAGLFLDWIAERREAPTDDYLSFLATMEIDGERLTSEQAMIEAMLLLGAGLDTTTSLMGHSIRYLSSNPDAKAWLAADPARLGPACDEFLRRFSPITSTARTATVDTVLNGQEIKAGDRVLLMWHAANQDPDVFDQPDEVRLDRQRNRHIAFASGPHRCIGARFAKAEWEIVIAQLLDRLPDFSVNEDATRPFPDVGITAGWITMPITFTPGARRGPGTLKIDSTQLDLQPKS